MSRSPIPTWCFALVIVHRGNRFLLVQERKGNQGWYFPAGRMEPGETWAETARRETLEEAGIPIELEGILRIEHTPSPHGARSRILFVARPADDTPPKSTPDEHSLRAGWFTLPEIAKMPLRSHEVLHTLVAIAKGQVVYPVSLLAPEGTPWETLSPEKA